MKRAHSLRLLCRPLELAHAAPRQLLTIQTSEMASLECRFGNRQFRNGNGSLEWPFLASVPTVAEKGHCIFEYVLVIFANSN